MTTAAEHLAPFAQDHPVRFLSHSGAATDTAKRLAERIEATPEASAAKLKVWLDKKHLEPGRGWQKQPERGIEERSTAFAVYLGALGAVTGTIERSGSRAENRATRSSRWLLIRWLRRSR